MVGRRFAFSESLSALGTLASAFPLLGHVDLSG